MENPDTRVQMLLQTPPQDISSLCTVDIQMNRLCQDFYFLKEYATRYRDQISFSRILNLLAKNESPNAPLNYRNWISPFVLDWLKNNYSRLPIEYNYLSEVGKQGTPNIIISPYDPRVQRSPLTFAGEKRHLLIVKFLISIGADPFLTYNKGREYRETIFRYLVEKNYYEIMEYLATLPFITEKFYFYPTLSMSLFSTALDNQNYRMADLILEYFVDPDFREKKMFLKFLPDTGDEIPKYLESRGFDLFASSPYGSYLHQVAVSDNLPSLIYFLRTGLDINQQDNENRTPLHVVIGLDSMMETPNTEDEITQQENNLNVRSLDILLLNGADPNLPDLDGNLPSFYILTSPKYPADPRTKRYHVMKELLDSGTNVLHQNQQGLTIIDIYKGDPYLSDLISRYVGNFPTVEP